MGLIKAFSDSISGTFAEQWKEIMTAGHFDEYVAVSPGILKSTNKGRGVNLAGSEGIISNGSKIFVPENTVAVIFNQSGIEEIITEAGGYEYNNGQETIFEGSTIGSAIFNQIKNRIAYGGISDDEKKVAFVNLREIRDIKFGTRGPQTYYDTFYGTDLEIFAYGSFTIKITDPIKFIKNYLPANTIYYTFGDTKVRSQILSEFLQSFMVAVNSLSDHYRISQLPSQAVAIAQSIANDSYNAGSWEERFGFKIVKVAIENIEFTEDSRQLVKLYATNKMSLKAFNEVSSKTSNIAAQQKIAQGIQENGLGDMGGMLFGMNMVQGLTSTAEQKTKELTIDEQIETLTKLKQLVDLGVLTTEEFDIKKKEIMGL